VKAAVLSAGLSSADRLFPEYFPAQDPDEAEAEAVARGDDVAFDYSGVKWEMPTADGHDPEEMLRLVQAMGANYSLSVGDDDDWSPEPDQVTVAVADDSEREWL